jgi:hypothetical protein
VTCQKCAKRNLFAELKAGVEAMQAHREGKLSLHINAVPVPTNRERAVHCANGNRKNSRMSHFN